MVYRCVRSVLVNMIVSSAAIPRAGTTSRGPRHRDERQQEPGEGITSSRFLEEPSALVCRQARIHGLERGHRAPGTGEAEPAGGTGQGPVAHLDARLVPAETTRTGGHVVGAAVLRRGGPLPPPRAGPGRPPRPPRPPPARRVGAARRAGPRGGRHR